MQVLVRAAGNAQGTHPRLCVPLTSFASFSRRRADGIVRRCWLSCARRDE
jgi:hypothetical protein